MVLIYSPEELISPQFSIAKYFKCFKYLDQSILQSSTIGRKLGDLFQSLLYFTSILLTQIRSSFWWFHREEGGLFSVKILNERLPSVFLIQLMYLSFELETQPAPRSFRTGHGCWLCSGPQGPGFRCGKTVCCGPRTHSVLHLCLRKRRNTRCLERSCIDSAECLKMNLRPLVPCVWESHRGLLPRRSQDMTLGMSSLSIVQDTGLVFQWIRTSAPQGSFLNPLLYPLYTHNSATKCCLTPFASLQVTLM